MSRHILIWQKDSYLCSARLKGIYANIPNLCLCLSAKRSIGDTLGLNSTKPWSSPVTLLKPRYQIKFLRYLLYILIFRLIYVVCSGGLAIGYEGFFLLLSYFVLFWVCFWLFWLKRKWVLRKDCANCFHSVRCRSFCPPSFFLVFLLVFGVFLGIWVVLFLLC